MQLTRFLRRSVRLYGPDIALVDRERALDWRGFGDRVARLAAAFRALGLGPGDRVAFLVGGSVDCVTLYFAPLWAGGVMVPLNLRWSEAELRDALALVAPCILVADAEHRERAVALAGDVPGLDHVLAAGPEGGGLPTLDALVARHDPAPDAEREDDDVAALFFTAGTTGPARAATLSHGNLVLNSLAAAVNLSVTRDAVQIHAQPLFHLAGAARVFTAVLAGARQVLLPRFDPGEVLVAIDAHGATHLGVVPTMLSMLLDHPAAETASLASLRVLGYGAAPMPEALLRRAMARLPGVRLVNSYGMTELSPVATCLTAEEHAAALKARPELLRSVGCAVWNVDVAVQDEAGRELPPGEPGEICVRGPTVMQRYWGDAQATKEVMRGRWLRTGDIGRMSADGYLWLIDRAKDIIITGGENVASIEVENVLCDCTGVRECAVVGRADPVWGEVVHAVVVLGAEVGCAALDAHCRARLAAYKVPRSWELRREPLPRTAAGKINKRELRA